MLFLSILQGIGFVLLYALAILLLLVLLVMFVPFRYKINIQYEKQLDFIVSVTWLFSIFSFITERRTKKTKLTWSFFGFQGKNKKRAAKSSSDELKQKSDQNKNLDKDNFSRIKKWHQYAEYPYKQEIINRTITLVKRLVRPARPKQLDCYARFGFADPGTTGLLLGALHAAIGTLNWGTRVSLCGDFDKEIVNVLFNASGNIKLWSWTWPLVAYVLSRPVWMIIKAKIFAHKKERI